MNAIELHQRLAAELAARNRAGSAEENWFRAGEILVQTKAYDLSQQYPERSSAENWAEAELFVRWNEWASYELGPYLAELCAEDSDFVAAQLERLALESRFPGHGWRCLALLDGAPEYGRSKFQLHSGNCVNPREVIERKDGAFYEIGVATTEFYDGVVLGEPSNDVGLRIDSNRRLFQDGFAVHFGVEFDIWHLITWAQQFKRRLSLYNERNSLAWSEELHLRLAIGHDWDTIARSVLVLYRGEFALDSPALLDLPPATIEMLSAVGLRRLRNQALLMTEEQCGASHEGGRILANAR